MKECSTEGIKLLRGLALAVRSEQDFDLAPNPAIVVGLLKKEDAVPGDVLDAKRRRGFQDMLKTNDYSPLKLRQALNKIAHADPQTADYYIDPACTSHDLLLFGTEAGRKWFAVISILQLIAAVRSLPDASVR